jgi:hypothetical protein
MPTQISVTEHHFVTMIAVYKTSHCKLSVGLVSFGMRGFEDILHKAMSTIYIITLAYDPVPRTQAL